ANKYTIAGTATLTLDSSSAVGITATNGSHDVTAPLALAKDATFTVASAASTLTLSNLQSSTSNLTKVGAGALVLNNIRANSITINAGSVSILAGRSTAGTSNVATLSIATNATLNLADQDLIATAATVDSVRSLIVR